MTRITSTRRVGYTLLEVLIASAIAALLLAALYVALDAAMIRMDTGRDQVGGNDFARALFNRIGNDLQGSLGPMQPKSGGGTPMESSSTSSTSSSATPSTSSSTGTSTSGTGSTSTSGSSTSGSGTTTSSSDTGSPDGTAVASDLPFQGGVFGTDKYVSVFLSRVPTTLTDPSAAADVETIHPADLRKATYYLGADGGLCRQERPWVTADGVRNAFEPDYSTELFDVIAPEVVDATFEYYDGGTWQGAWDGSQPGLDGVTPIGPPRAIRVTLIMEFPGRSGQMVQKKVQQVIPLRAAVGNYVAPTEGAATDPATTGTTTSGGM